MRIEATQARARIMRLVERITVLEAALEQCRALALRGSNATGAEYCRQIEEVAGAALDSSPV